MIKDLESAIGYQFQNIQLLQNALTHSSFANERWHNSLLSNERLEFLGDSVLGMLVAEYLYHTFPDRPEGELTRMRADMVCEHTLATVANRSVWERTCFWAMVKSAWAAETGNPFWRMPRNLSLRPVFWTAVWRRQPSL